ncbi:hypothetical protein BJ170DRAFT_694460 [Xylariales sp. AK1849]|nr:hypothetical protein BJ170DRAFT_694460 [Xylariales sp. AK1849]
MAGRRRAGWNDETDADLVISICLYGQLRQNGVQEFGRVTQGRWDHIRAEMAARGHEYEIYQMAPRWANIVRRLRDVQVVAQRPWTRNPALLVAQLAGVEVDGLTNQNPPPADRDLRNPAVRAALGIGGAPAAPQPRSRRPSLPPPAPVPDVGPPPPGPLLLGPLHPGPPGPPGPAGPPGPPAPQLRPEGPFYPPGHPFLHNPAPRAPAPVSPGTLTVALNHHGEGQRWMALNYLVQDMAEATLDGFRHTLQEIQSEILRFVHRVDLEPTTFHLLEHELILILTPLTNLDLAAGRGRPPGGVPVGIGNNPVDNMQRFEHIGRGFDEMTEEGRNGARIALREFRTGLRRIVARGGFDYPTLFHISLNMTRISSPLVQISREQGDADPDPADIQPLIPEDFAPIPLYIKQEPPAEDE